MIDSCSGKKLQSKVDKEVQDEGVNRNNYEIGVDLFEAIDKLKQFQKEIQKKINQVKNINWWKKKITYLAIQVQ